jgi:hypothetical protein
MPPSQAEIDAQNREREEREERERRIREEEESFINASTNEQGIRRDQGPDVDAAYQAQMDAERRQRLAEGIGGRYRPDKPLGEHVGEYPPIGLPPLARLPMGAAQQVGKRVTRTSPGIAAKAQEIYGTKPEEVARRQAMIAQSRAHPPRETNEIYPYTEINYKGEPVGDTLNIPVPYAPGQMRREIESPPGGTIVNGVPQYRARGVIDEHTADPNLQELRRKNIRIGFRKGYEPNNRDVKIPLAPAAPAGPTAFPRAAEPVAQARFTPEESRNIYQNMPVRRAATLQKVRSRAMAGGMTPDNVEEIEARQEAATRAYRESLAQNPSQHIGPGVRSVRVPTRGIPGKTERLNILDYDPQEVLENFDNPKLKGAYDLRSERFWGAPLEILRDPRMTDEVKEGYRQRFENNLNSWAANIAEKEAGDIISAYNRYATSGSTAIEPITDDRLVTERARIMKAISDELIDRVMRNVKKEPFYDHNEDPTAKGLDPEEVEKRNRYRSYLATGIDTNRMALEDQGDLIDNEHAGYEQFARYPDAYPTEPNIPIPSVSKAQGEDEFNEAERRANELRGTADDIARQVRSFHGELNKKKYAAELRELEDNFRREYRALPADDKRGRASLFADFMREMQDLHLEYGTHADLDYIDRHRDAISKYRDYRNLARRASDAQKAYDDTKKQIDDGEEEIRKIERENKIGDINVAPSAQQQAKIASINYRKDILLDLLFDHKKNLFDLNREQKQLEDEIADLNSRDIEALHPEKYRKAREEDMNLLGSVFDYISDDVSQARMQDRIHQMYQNIEKDMDEFDDMSPTDVYRLDQERRKALNDIAKELLIQETPGHMAPELAPYDSQTVNAYREGLDRINDMLAQQMRGMSPEDLSNVSDMVRQDAILEKGDKMTEDDAKFLADRNKDVFHSLYGGAARDMEKVHDMLSDELEDMSNFDVAQAHRANEEAFKSIVDGGYGLPGGLDAITKEIEKRREENEALYSRIEGAGRPGQFKTAQKNLNEAVDRSYVDRGDEGRVAPDTIAPERKYEDERREYFRDLIKKKSDETKRPEDYIEQHLSSDEYRSFPGWVDSAAWEANSVKAGPIRVYGEIPDGMIPPESEIGTRQKIWKGTGNWRKFLQAFIPGFKEGEPNYDLYHPILEGSNRNTYQMSNNALYTIVHGLGAMRISAGTNLPFTPEYRQAIDNIKELWNFALKHASKPKGQQAMQAAKLAYEQLSAVDRGFYKHSSTNLARAMGEEAKTGATDLKHDKGSRPTAVKGIDYNSPNPQQLAQMKQGLRTEREDAEAFGMDLKDYQRYMKDAIKMSLAEKPEDVKTDEKGRIAYSGPRPIQYDENQRWNPDRRAFRSKKDYEEYFDDVVGRHNVDQYLESEQAYHQNRLPFNTPKEALTKFMSLATSGENATEIRDNIMTDVIGKVMDLQGMKFFPDKVVEIPGSFEPSGVLRTEKIEVDPSRYGGVPVFSPEMANILQRAYPEVDSKVIDALSFVSLSDIIYAYDKVPGLSYADDPTHESTFGPYLEHSYNNPWATRRRERERLDREKAEREAYKAQRGLA